MPWAYRWLLHDWWQAPGAISPSAVRLSFPILKGEDDCVVGWWRGFREPVHVEGLVACLALGWCVEMLRDKTR